MLVANALVLGLVCSCPAVRANSSVPRPEGCAAAVERDTAGSGNENEVGSSVSTAGSARARPFLAHAASVHAARATGGVLARSGACRDTYIQSAVHPARLFFVIICFQGPRRGLYCYCDHLIKPHLIFFVRTCSSSLAGDERYFKFQTHRPFRHRAISHASRGAFFIFIFKKKIKNICRIEKFSKMGACRPSSWRQDLNVKKIYI